jgi:hypothetical protein
MYFARSGNQSHLRKTLLNELLKYANKNIFAMERAVYDDFHPDKVIITTKNIVFDASVIDRIRNNAKGIFSLQ